MCNCQLTKQYWVLSANRRNLPIIKNLRNGKPIAHGFRMMIHADCVFRTHVLLKNGGKWQVTWWPTITCLATYRASDGFTPLAAYRRHSAGLRLEPRHGGGIVWTNDTAGLVCAGLVGHPELLGQVTIVT